MPIPKPTTNETEDEFISRCMGDEVMNEDYPDNEQRSGVCYSQWQNRNKAMNKHITTQLEIKTLGKREFEGYGSIFGNKDYGDDVVMPGAFTRTLAEHKSNNALPMMFWMHDPTRIPGKWLEMEEDSNGLYVKGVLADTDLGNEMHTLLNMKAFRGLSIGYVTQKSEYTDDGTRLIKDADLWETSLVSLGMNPLALVHHVKSRLSEQGEYVPAKDEVAQLKRKCEQFLRDEGFSQKLAKVYATNLFRESSEMLEPPTATVDDKGKEPTQLIAATAEEVEVIAGVSSFKEKQEAYEIDQIMKRYFR